MFKLSPEVFTVKDIASGLRLTASAIQKSIKRTGTVRGVKVKHQKGMILFSRDEYERIMRI